MRSKLAKQTYFSQEYNEVMSHHVLNHENFNHKIVVHEFFPKTDNNQLINKNPILLHIHGITLHTKFYHEYIESITGVGVRYFGIDLNGHGDSRYNKCHIDKIELLCDSVLESINLITQKYSNPVILSGHSLGALIIIILFSKYKDKIEYYSVNKIILISPAFSIVERYFLGLSLNKLALVISRVPFIAKMTIPRFISKLSASELSENKDIYSEIDNDKKIKKNPTIMFFAIVIREVRRLNSYIRDIKEIDDLLIIHGLNDKIVSTKENMEISKKIGAKYKRNILVNTGHCPTKSKEAKYIFSIIHKFILRKNIYK